MRWQRKRPAAGMRQGEVHLHRNRTADNTRSLAHKQPRPVPAPDLIGLRERLLEARRRLVERLAEDYPADRRFPDSRWTRMLAATQAAIPAVDAVVAAAPP